MKLTGRLLVSYALVIFIALALAFVTLLLVARPIQNRVATARLVTQSRLFTRQLENRLPLNFSPEQIIRLINNRPADSSFHLIFVDTAGTVQADNQNNWLGLPFAALAGDNQTGRFDAPDGTVYNFAAAPVGRAGYIVAVTPRVGVVPTFVRELGWGFGLAGVVALLVSLLASAVIARSVARPLEDIAQAATAVAGGDYAQRVPEDGPPEIRRVAASFNLMAGRVAASQQAMRDFVSNVSHELKTPLTSIRGFSQAIMEGATPDDAARQRAAGIINQEAGRMARLVEDLLDLARIDAGQVAMQKTKLDLAPILDSTASRLLPQAAAKNISLKKKWENLPLIVGDGDRLAQVFTNLLDNAVRHTPAGGAVTLSASAERGDFVQVSVSDTGPGIPPADLARIFERFYQVDKSRQRGQGTGLGLAIIKEIVEAHRGTVRAESVEGVGTKFSVLLPVTEADARSLILPRQ